MTEQHESRWSLNHTGNRVLLAAVIGLAVGMLGSAAGATGGAHVLVFLIAAGVAYVLLTTLRRR